MLLVKGRHFSDIVGAFEGFAAIQTQSDVMSFNMKYGVELVIPAQEV